MVKYDLRQRGFSVHERKQKQSIITVIWAFLTLLIISSTIFSVFGIFLFILGYDGEDLRDMRDKTGNSLSSFLEGNFWAFIIVLIAALLLYMTLRFIMTILFCDDRNIGAKIKILSDKAIPVCHCREALTTGQTVLIYIVPFVIVYFALSALCFWTYADGHILMVLFFMAFFMAFDLTAVVYTLFFKIKDKIDYIAINNHIYEVTLYRYTYIRNRGTERRNIKAAKERRRTRVFTKMTTCGNPDCENYAEKLEDGKGVCPACGQRKYKAEVFDTMKTCLNPGCDNYGHELKDIEYCSLCDTKTGKLALLYNPNLTTSAIAISIISVVVFGFINWIIYYFGLTGDIDPAANTYGGGPMIDTLSILKYIAVTSGIIMAILSKSKTAVIIAVLAFLAAVGLGVLYGDIIFMVPLLLR